MARLHLVDVHLFLLAHRWRYVAPVHQGTPLGCATLCKVGAGVYSAPMGNYSDVLLVRRSLTITLKFCIIPEVQH
jgi:hypothetical protein